MRSPMLISFVFENVNTEENPFIFDNTTATNISLILSVYFGDVHNVLHRFKTCQSAEISCVEALSFKIRGPLGKRSFCDDVVIKLETLHTTIVIIKYVFCFAQYCVNKVLYSCPFTFTRQ